MSARCPTVEEVQQLLEAPMLLASPATDLWVIVVAGQIQGAQQVQGAPGQVRSLFAQFEVVDEVAFVPDTRGGHEREGPKGGGKVRFFSSCERPSSSEVVVMFPFGREWLAWSLWCWHAFLPW